MTAHIEGYGAIMQIKIADYKKPQKRIPKYYYYENRFFPDFRRSRERIWKIFSLKPSRDQDEDNDIRYNLIGSAVFELLGDIHTNTVLLYMRLAASPPASSGKRYWNKQS